MFILCYVLHTNAHNDNDNDNDNELILFGHKKNSKNLNIVDLCIMLIMLVIDNFVCPGDLISAL